MNDLQATGKWIFDFLILTVGVKMIIGHWVAERLGEMAHVWFGSTPRKEAIWLHYQARAAGLGHKNDDVTKCGEDRCQLFNP